MKVFKSLKIGCKSGKIAITPLDNAKAKRKIRAYESFLSIGPT